MDKIVLGIVIVVVVLLLVFVIATYNSLVQLRNRVRDQWSQIDIQLKRRFDLIPNLVETVKGYMKHEAETLENIVKARNTYQYLKLFYPYFVPPYTKIISQIINQKKTKYLVFIFL